MDYSKYIKSVPNFPVEGILFRDVMPLVNNGEAYKSAIHELAEFAKKSGADLICGPESRGFIFGCPVAAELGVGFVPVRKAGKLPGDLVSASYELEYGTNTICIQIGSIKKGQKVVIIDDLLATGGTIEATIELIEKLGGVVTGMGYLIELEDLKAREKFKKYNFFTLLKYKEFE